MFPSLNFAILRRRALRAGFLLAGALSLVGAGGSCASLERLIDKWDKKASEAGAETGGTTPSPAKRSPLIERFEVTPLRIRRGESARLVWSVRDAESARVEPSLGTLPLVSETTVQPTVNTTYTLYASTAQETTTRQVTLEVEQPAAPELWRVAVTLNSVTNLPTSAECASEVYFDFAVIAGGTQRSETLWKDRTDRDISTFSDCGQTISVGSSHDFVLAPTDLVRVVLTFHEKDGSYHEVASLTSELAGAIAWNGASTHGVITRDAYSVRAPGDFGDMDFRVSYTIQATRMQ